MSVGNNGSRLVGNTEFYGGLSTDDKIGIENSYSDGECLDVRKSPSQMTVLPMSRKLPDGDVITGLMTAMTQSKDGDIWGIDENGALYEIGENNAITKVSGGTGNITNVVSSTITNVRFDRSLAYPTLEAQGETYTGEFDSGAGKWKCQGEGGGGYTYLTKDELREDMGITYSGSPANGDAITIEFTVGAYSSGFGLEYSDIDDVLWASDGGHKLLSYGKIMNPMGTTRASHVFECMNDDSARIVNAIEIQYGTGMQLFYQANPDIIRKNGNQTCDIPTSISETIVSGTELTSRLRKFAVLFLPAATPIVRIGIGFTAKGSGTVQLVIHDEQDNVVASSQTMAASSVTTSDYTWFDVRPNPSSNPSPANQFCPVPWAGDTIEAGSVYHIHIVASSSGYKIRTSVAGDMSLTGNIYAQAYVLHNTYNGKHPMTMFDKLYIGNGRYVSTKGPSPANLVNDDILIQDALRLDDGFEVCCFGSSDEYLMIGAEKYNARADRGFQAGRIYFWDRSTEAPNFYVDCTMGAPKAIFNLGNIVYIIIAGALYAYTGGKELVKVRTLKGTDTEYTGSNSITEVNPNMMAVRREVLVMGFPSNTTAYTIRHGIYAFGSVDKNYPNCYTYNYKIPGETAQETLEQYNSDTQKLRIGCVYNFNDTLYYSYEVRTYDAQTETWSTDTALAVVDNESGTSTSFLWKSLQYDAGAPYLEKMALRIGVYFDPLPANTTITPIYRIDNGPWIQGPHTATVGERLVHCDINKRFHELQYGFIGTTGNDNLTPVIKQVSAEIRVLNEEQKL